MTRAGPRGNGAKKDAEEDERRTEEEVDEGGRHVHMARMMRRAATYRVMEKIGGNLAGNRQDKDKARGEKGKNRVQKGRKGARAVRKAGRQAEERAESSRSFHQESWTTYTAGLERAEYNKLYIKAMEPK